MALDYPSIDTSNKSNEQNLQSTKAYLIALADTYNYQINALKDAINNLESRVASLEGRE